MSTVAGKAALAVGKLLLGSVVTVVVTYGIPMVITGTGRVVTYAKCKIKNELTLRKEMKNLNAELETVIA